MFEVKHDTQTYDGIDMCCSVIIQRLPQNKRMRNAMYMNYLPLNMEIDISTPFLARFTPFCRSGCRVIEALYLRFFMVHPDR